jgi:proteasome lid subunit RPN8/RPN11
MIHLPRVHFDAIQRHGEATYPEECCGIMVGKLLANGEKTVEELLPITNARESENRHNRFLITPDDLMRGELAARKKKLDVVGFYHSHPDHPAVPSEFDREHAWPTYSYVIVAVAKAVAGDLLSWELKHDRTRFNPEPITD